MQNSISIPDPNTNLSSSAVIAAVPGGGLIITTPAGQIALTRSLARKLAIQLQILSQDPAAPIAIENWPTRKEA